MAIEVEMVLHFDSQWSFVVELQSSGITPSTRAQTSWYMSHLPAAQRSSCNPSENGSRADDCARFPGNGTDGWCRLQANHSLFKPILSLPF
eukprot:3767497-Amphidinium_carterae.1